MSLKIPKGTVARRNFLLQLSNATAFHVTREIAFCKALAKLCWIQHCLTVCHTRSSNNFWLIKCWMKFDFHQTYCPTNMFDQQMFDSLAMLQQSCKGKKVAPILRSPITCRKLFTWFNLIGRQDGGARRSCWKSNQTTYWTISTQRCALFADMWFNFLQNLVELLRAHPRHLLNPRIVHF